MAADYNEDRAAAQATFSHNSENMLSFEKIIDNIAYAERCEMCP